MPPPPGLPLCPLHRLARALTCEIKRDFNYLSAKQQLERITAQQLSPPPLPLPALLPPFPSPYPVLRESSSSAQAPHAPGLGFRGQRAGQGTSPRGRRAGRSGGHPCACTPWRQTVAVSLGSVCALEGAQPRERLARTWEHPRVHADWGSAALGPSPLHRECGAVSNRLLQ